MKKESEFIQLLTGSQSRLYGYILSLVFDPDKASDLLQQTNAILWEKKAEFSIGTNFIAWSFRIAYFQVLAHRKQLQRSKLAFDTELMSEIASKAAESDENFEERQRALRHCLERLPPKQREMVRRRYDDDSNLNAIAADTQMTVNAVKQGLFRARSALAQCVQKTLQQEGLA